MLRVAPWRRFLSPTCVVVGAHQRAVTNAAYPVAPIGERVDGTKALSLFLLKNELDPVVEISKDNNTKNGDNNKVKHAVRYTLRPVADQYWMPDPTLYRHWNLPSEFYALLEQLQSTHLAQTPFRTRLLLLQAFVQPEWVPQLLAREPRQRPLEAKLQGLTNDRLVPYGEAQMRLAWTYFFYRRFPQVSSRTVRSFTDKLVSEQDSLLAAVVDQLQPMSVLVQERVEEVPVALQQYQLQTALPSPNGGGDRAVAMARKRKADTLRALVGALWLDQGTESSLEFLHRHIVPRLAVHVERKRMQ